MKMNYDTEMTAIDWVLLVLFFPIIIPLLVIYNAEQMINDAIKGKSHLKALFGWAVLGIMFLWQVFIVVKLIK